MIENRRDNRVEHKNVTQQLNYTTLISFFRVRITLEITFTLFLYHDALPIQHIPFFFLFFLHTDLRYYFKLLTHTDSFLTPYIFIFLNTTRIVQKFNLIQSYFHRNYHCIHPYYFKLVTRLNSISPPLVSIDSFLTSSAILMTIFIPLEQFWPQLESEVVKNGGEKMENGIEKWKNEHEFETHAVFGGVGCREFEVGRHGAVFPPRKFMCRPAPRNYAVDEMALAENWTNGSRVKERALNNLPASFSHSCATLLFPLSFSSLREIVIRERSHDRYERNFLYFFPPFFFDPSILYRSPAVIKSSVSERGGLVYSNNRIFSKQDSSQSGVDREFWIFKH